MMVLGLLFVGMINGVFVDVSGQLILIDVNGVYFGLLFYKFLVKGVGMFFGIVGCFFGIDIFVLFDLGEMIGQVIMFVNLNFIVLLGEIVIFLVGGEILILVSQGFGVVLVEYK